MVVRKVWGDVAGGKVVVNILTDYGTPDEKVIRKVISLENDARAVAVMHTLKTGTEQKQRHYPFGENSRVESSIGRSGSRTTRRSL